ncbi:hypothetical protein LINGRAPRIM_LOCUS2280, partial [Linum grandiflorum]
MRSVISDEINKIIQHARGQTSQPLALGVPVEGLAFLVHPQLMLRKKVSLLQSSKNLLCKILKLDCGYTNILQTTCSGSMHQL